MPEELPIDTSMKVPPTVNSMDDATVTVKYASPWELQLQFPAPSVETDIPDPPEEAAIAPICGAAWTVGLTPTSAKANRGSAASVVLAMFMVDFGLVA